MSKNYCGIKRVKTSRCKRSNSNTNVFNPKNEPYVSLGDQIVAALEYDSQLGSPAVVQYDNDTADGVDVLTSPDHDFNEIAEQFGMPDQQPNPVPAPAPDPDISE